MKTSKRIALLFWSGVVLGIIALIAALLDLPLGPFKVINLIWAPLIGMSAGLWLMDFARNWK